MTNSFPLQNAKGAGLSEKPRPLSFISLSDQNL